MASVLLPHPLTGRPFASPVAPGTGWPGDTVVILCRACPRLVGWREDVATTKRAAFADQQQHRFTHRRATDFQFFGEFRHAQAAARSQLTRQDR